MTMALPPGGKGLRELRCIECDPLADERAKGWVNSSLKPPVDPKGRSFSGSRSHGDV
jgi:hypothetical protein